MFEILFIDEPISNWIIIPSLCAWLSIFISFYEINQHLINFNKPNLQKYIIKIIWMVPIYSINSWLILIFPSLTIYLNTLRECYEAFVIYSFMKYLFYFLYREMEIDTIIDSKPQVKHLFPFKYFFSPMLGGQKFLYNCKHGILQYTVVRPITTFIALILELFGFHFSGGYSLLNIYTYLLIVNNISQMCALYFLILFYKTYKTELNPIKPFSKFICIKAVIFMSFFQACIIYFLIQFGIIKDFSNTSYSSIDSFLQNYLICIEMFLASIAHIYAFSYKPYVDLTTYKQSAYFSFRKVLDFSEERTDISDHLNQIYSRLKVFIKRKKFHEENQDYEVLISLTPTVSGSTVNQTKYQSTDITNY